MLLPLSNFYLFIFQLHLHQTQCMWVSYLCICNNYTLCVCALLSHKRWNIRFNWQHVQAFIVSINEWRMQISLKFLYTRIYIINLNVLNWKHFRNSRAHLTNVFLFPPKLPESPMTPEQLALNDSKLPPFIQYFIKVSNVVSFSTASLNVFPDVTLLK